MLAAALLVACTHGTPLAVRATPTEAATGTAPESVVRAVQAATDPISAAEALTSFMISAMSGKLAQDSLTAAGGVEAIALHLISGDSNTRGAAALALAHLTSNVEGVAEEQPVAAQAALVKAGAIGTLVSSLSHETDWTLLEATIHALYNALVLCEPAQDALVDAGGVEALSLQLNDVRLSKKARSAVLLTLRALSSLARVKEAVLDAGTIDALAAFAAANRDDEVVQQETFNALYELAQARAHASPSHTVLALFELPHKPPARAFSITARRHRTAGTPPECGQNARDGNPLLQGGGGREEQV